MIRLLSQLALPLGLASVALSCVVEYDAARDTESDDEDGDGDGNDDGNDEDDDATDCEAPEIPCDGTCVDVRTDPEHCGACGTSCEDDTQCAAGLCRRPCSDECRDPYESCLGSFCECTPGLTNCAGECVDLGTDPAHCGQCERACGDDLGCGNGVCQPAGCADFPDDCGGECTDVQSDRFRCGDCDVACGVDELCIEGECVFFDTLPGDVCQECPCEEVCQSELHRCCFSELYDSEICVDAPTCP